MIRRVLTTAATLLALLSSTAALAADPPAQPFGWSADASAGAAAAYCMAKHPYNYLTSQISGKYTKDGFELVSAPGVVGAVRRNFVYDRTTDAYDEGVKQTCAQACAQFGKAWGLTGGKSLRQKIGDGTVFIASGLGDLGALVMRDQDSYLGGQTVGLIGSRANTYHESDVAQADYCCCHAM